MKRVISLSLAIFLCLALCACGKSEEVINVESQIATLTAESTYKEIHDVYMLYRALPYEDREDVENSAVLAEYCQLTSGNFVLTEAMLDEIKEKFEVSSLGIPSAVFAISWEFSFQKNYFKDDWNDHGNIEIVSTKKENAYTYMGYGSMKIQDKYGSVSTHNVDISYFAEFSDEEEAGYKISSDVNIR